MNTSENYITDFKLLNKKRPIGVSGILRCNNNADYIEACIDSCIDALDELIIVYHDCIDDTEEILSKKQKQFIDKIKVYYYKPYIYPIDLNDDSFAEVMALPPTSVHLLSGYTNYAVSKTTYQFVIKIDSDQVYFTEKLVTLCNAYRSNHKVKIGLLECVAYNLYKAYQCSFHREEMKAHLWLEIIAIWMYPFYFSYAVKMVINYKIPVSLSGFNLYTDGEKWMVGLGDRKYNILPPFNGVKDTFFFKVSETAVYDRVVQYKDKHHYRVLEFMRCDQELLDIGFTWFHLRAIIYNNKEYFQKLYKAIPERFIPLQVFLQFNYRKLVKTYHPFIAVTFAESIFSYFHTATRHEIPWNQLVKLLNIYNEYHRYMMNKKGRINRRDYYLEFHEELDNCLQTFVKKRIAQNPLTFQVGNYSIEIPVTTYLFYQLMKERERFNECRKNGKSIEDSLAKVNSYLDHFTWDEEVMEHCNHIEIEESDWYNGLLPYKNHLLIYLFNQRQLNYLTPLLKCFNCPTILLCEYELPVDTDLPSCATAITLDCSQEHFITNSNIKRNFPPLFEYTNIFEILIRIISPQCVICLEGCHCQEQLLAIVAHNYSIPSIGIQQGWPSFVRTGFKRLPFEYYFTWGSRFNLCWQKDNPGPKFVEMGYMYEIEDKLMSPIKRDCISFFLQGPLFLSDNSYQQEFMNLIKEQAISFPNQVFLVREHPEFTLSESDLIDFSKLSNIELVAVAPLKEVFRRSRVVVSHFSSSIMECLVHGAVPLVYDPTTNSCYYPNIEQEKLGMIAKTPNEFNSKLSHILTNYPLFQNHIHKELHSWFSNTGKETLEAMKDYIAILCPTLFTESPHNN